MQHALRALLAVVVLLFTAATALADNWVAVKLRGQVLQLIDQQWLDLKRGDVVPDDRVIRTMKSGRVTFQRGRELIEVGPQTQIRIVDKPGRSFTTVLQDFGTVSIEADVRNVEHFSVKTPHLAAVVKGTKFTVTSGKSDASVKVTRGRVAVEDQHSGQSVLVTAGQTASTEVGGNLDVSGRGSNKAVIVDRFGKPVVHDVVSDLFGPAGGSGKGGAVGNALGSTGSAIGGSVGGTVGAVGGTVSAVGSAAGSTVSAVSSGVGNTVSSVGDSVGGAVGGSVGSTVSSVTETVGGTVGSVGGAVGGLVGGLF